MFVNGFKKQVHDTKTDPSRTRVMCLKPEGVSKIILQIFNSEFQGL
jgi:hypothetical protein